VTKLWTDDKLDREECARFLTNYLQKRYTLARTAKKQDTLVLNVRANWGFGKTFFIERWSNDLKRAGHPIVHFDAWANDFSEDPLIGFIASMDDALKSHFKNVPAIARQIDRTLSVVKKLVKPVSMGLVGVLTKNLTGISIDQIKEALAEDDVDIDQDSEDSGAERAETAVNDIKSIVSKCAEAAIKEHLSKRETIRIFKLRLGRLVSALEDLPNVQLPMFVFVDELDRCRPSYAIELLEGIKHLFGVHGIYFITATNLDQLGHSIGAVYGEKFDAESYLKRFFDQEYVLPQPNAVRYTEVLFERHALIAFDRFFSPLDPGVYSNTYGSTPDAHVLFTEFSAAFGISFRCQDQIASALQALAFSWPQGEPMHLPLVLFYLMIKQKSAAIFDRLSNPSFNGDALKQAVKGIMDTEYVIHHSYVNNAINSVSIFSLVNEYLSRLEWDETTIRDHLNAVEYPGRILFSLMKGHSQERRNKRLPFAIREYHGRVSRAGQLSSV